MECFGRLMAGIVPWLQVNALPGSKSSQLREWALAAYRNAVDPSSADYLCWGSGGQNLVDAAYIAESFLRAYETLWVPLDTLTKKTLHCRVCEAQTHRPTLHQLASLFLYNRKFYCKS